jgi:hypothetical protein
VSISIVADTEIPYAVASAVELWNISTTVSTATIRIQLMYGT